MKALATIGLSAILCGTALAQTQPKAPFTLSKETTFITSPLNADGTPNYIQALNDKYGKGVTAQNNGFVAFLEAVGTSDETLDADTRVKILQLLGTKPVEKDVAVFQAYDEFLHIDKSDQAKADQIQQELKVARQKLWREIDYPGLVAYLHAQAKFLDRIVEASSRPHWWVPAVSSDGRSMLNVTLPSMGKERQAIEALLARATWCATKSDMAGYQRDLLAAKRLARQIASGPTFIHRLVGIAMNAMSNDALGAAVGAGALTEAQCNSLKGVLRALPPMPLVADCANEIERTYLLDILAIMSTGKQDLILPKLEKYSDDFATATKWFSTLKRSEVDWDVVMKETNHSMDLLVAMMKSPTVKELRETGADLMKRRHQWFDEAKLGNSLAKFGGESRDAYSRRVARAFLGIFLPEVARPEELSRKGRNQEQMALLLLAAAQSKAKTGKWPGSLQELVPSYIDVVLHDLYPVDSPGLIKYVVMPSGVRVYSIDENERDDGGVRQLDKGTDDLGIGIFWELSK